MLITLTEAERAQMTPRQLEILAAIEAANGNQCRAAEALDLHQTAVYRQLRMVEAIVGRRLFRRASGRPTNTGELAANSETNGDGDCGRCGHAMVDDIEHACPNAPEPLEETAVFYMRSGEEATVGLGRRDIWGGQVR